MADRDAATNAPLPRGTAQRRRPFTDPVRGDECMLHVEPMQPAFDGIWVEHPGCEELADVSIDLDAFYCAACGRSGRVSGAWALDVWAASRG